VNSRQFLEQLRLMLRRLRVAVGKYLVLAPECPTFIVNIDATLLRRVLTNMVKNAFEASGLGETVTIGCRESHDAYEFFVASPAPLPLVAQRQIFKRSFSTKGPGRGLGTYSMKLFGERYLGGRVGFCSSESQGAEFFISLPKTSEPE
jgi:signal transduction histidine kinase